MSVANRSRTRVLLPTILLGLFSCVVRDACGETQFRGDLTHRPRVTFDGRDSAHIQRTIARIHNKEEPWASAYSALRDRAENGKTTDYRTSGWEKRPDKWAELYGDEVQNGITASSKAAVAWLWTKGCDPAWRPVPRKPGDATAEGWCKDRAAEAATTIDRMYDDWPCAKGWKVINRGIVAADSLAEHCTAYDLLDALPQNVKPALASAAKHLADFASDLDFWFFTVKPQKNNHPIRVAAGLGTAAIVLNKYDAYRWWKTGTWNHRPAKWIGKSTDALDPSRKKSAWTHVTTTGGYAKGTSYYTYAADMAVPFAFGYTRFLSGGAPGFFTADRFVRPALWALDLRLPDGRRPPVDNATYHHEDATGFFLSQIPGGARSVSEQAALLWDWREAGFPGAGGRHALGLLAAFDPSSAVVAASTKAPWSEPSRILVDEGQAVLRTGAGPDDAWAIVNAEHGDARTRGAGHDSVDHGAFQLWLRGDLVTIDPGYAGFSQGDKTNKAEHRSMVLVDGKGPRPPKQPLGILEWVSAKEDAFIVRGPRTQTSGPVKSALVQTSYEDAALARTVALVEDRWLLVEDRCSAKKSKTFTSLVQLNAGAAKGAAAQANAIGATFVTHRKKVPAAVGFAASAPLSVQLATGAFDATGDSPSGHDVVRASASGSSVTFLAAVAANPAGAPPAIEVASVTGGAVALRVAAGGRVDVVVSNPRGGSVTVAASAATKSVTTDAELAIVSFDANGQGTVLARFGGTKVTVGP